MNRAQRRAAEAREKMARNASRVTDRIESLVETGHLLADELDRYKRLLFSIAREHGRLRVKADHLRALGEHDRIDFIHQDNGDVILDYKTGKA